MNCEMIGMLSGGKWDKLIDSNRRVCGVNGISPTVTACGGGNQEVKIAEPVLVGGIGKINFGTQYRQGNRIYDSEAVAMALLAEPVGNAGGKQLFV